MKVRICSIAQGILLLLLLFGPAAAKNLNLNQVLALPEFHWVKYSSASFDFYAEQGGYAERKIERVKQAMEHARTRIDDLLGQRVEIRMPVFLVTSRERNRLIVGFDTNAVTTGEYQADTYNETLNATGGHETMHVLAGRVWGKPSGTWVNEGLAVYSDDAWHGKPLHGLARTLLDRHELVPLSDLVKKKGFLGSDEVTYPQLGSLMKFVYETHGRAAVKSLWQRKPNQRQVEGLEQEWLAMLKRLPE
jgi:hypothetical protein